MSESSACLRRNLPARSSVRGVHLCTAADPTVPRSTHRNLWNGKLNLFSLFIAAQIWTQKRLDLSSLPSYNHDTSEDNNTPRKAKPFGECLDLTTFLTIDRVRTPGNNGTESCGKYDLSEQRPLNGTKKVRKKIALPFGYLVEIARIVQQFVRKTHFICDYVEHLDKKNHHSLFYILI